jgi:methylated-DNA-[protein]-cysteine S-methyltransferase
MEARLAAPFGTVHVHLDGDQRVQRVELSPHQQASRVPDAVPDPLVAAFDVYLEGETGRPEVPIGTVDVTDFQRTVLEALTGIEPGRTVTYGELAHRIGNPGAARAVGQALRHNPLPLVWPCHRVVARDGLGGFGGASEAEGPLAIKRWLLDHERSHLAGSEVDRWGALCATEP